VQGFFTYAYSYVKRRVSLRNENRPKGRFSCALCTRGLTAYPLLKSEVFGS
jgi:hypothetical protein